MTTESCSRGHYFQEQPRAPRPKDPYFAHRGDSRTRTQTILQWPNLEHLSSELIKVIDHFVLLKRLRKQAGKSKELGTPTSYTIGKADWWYMNSEPRQGLLQAPSSTGRFGRGRAINSFEPYGLVSAGLGTVGEQHENFGAFVETDSWFETPIRSMLKARIVLGKYGKRTPDTMLCSGISRDENEEEYEKWEAVATGAADRKPSSRLPALKDWCSTSGQVST